MKINYLNSTDDVNEGAIPFMGGMDPTMGVTQFNVQGNSLGPIYQILPMTRDLEQKPNEIDNRMYVHPGTLVRGVGINNPDRHFTGRVARIIKNGDGSIACLYILTERTRKFVTISPDNLEIVTFSEESQSRNPNIMTQENVFKAN